MLDAFLYILMSVFGILSVILGVIAPLFSFVAYCDLKNGRRLPVVVHLSGFFGLFTFAAVVTIIFKGPDIPLLLKVPGAVGLVLLWISALYLATFRKNATLAEINRPFYQQFVEFLLSKLSINSARLMAVLLKARLHDAFIDGMIASMPDLYGIAPKKESTDIEFLTLDELKALVATDAPEEVKNPFLFCCFTGLRFSDVKALRWENIENGIIVLRMRKTREMVRVPLSENARRFLPEAREKGLVFRIGPLNTLSRRLKLWAENAGVKKDLHFHMSRHTFGTLTLENGADIYTVSKLLGHKSVETTQIYAKVLDEGRKKAVDAIPLL